MQAQKTSDGKLRVQVKKKDFSVHEDKLHEHWAKEKPLHAEGKKYSVHKMSYGDYFLEPHGKERGEKEGFAHGTKWLKRTDKKGNYGLEPEYE